MDPLEDKPTRQLHYINRGYAIMVILVIFVMLFLLVKNTIYSQNLLNEVEDIIAVRTQENREREARQQDALQRAFDRIDELERNIDEHLDRNDMLLKRVARALNISDEEIENSLESGLVPR